MEDIQEKGTCTGRKKKTKLSPSNCPEGVQTFALNSTAVAGLIIKCDKNRAEVSGSE